MIIRTIVSIFLAFGALYCFVMALASFFWIGSRKIVLLWAGAGLAAVIVLYLLWHKALKQ